MRCGGQDIHLDKLEQIFYLVKKKKKKKQKKNKQTIQYNTTSSLTK